MSVDKQGVEIRGWVSMSVDKQGVEIQSVCRNVCTFAKFECTYIRTIKCKHYFLLSQVHLSISIYL